MFTGIIEELGTIKAVRAGQLSVRAEKTLEGTRVGDSIAVNGVCLTVTALGNKILFADVMTETLQRTNLGLLHPGDRVNLERPLSLDGRLGGHLVQGHVDATGELLSLIPQGEALLVRFTAPPQVMRYIVEKGFIAADGASLTVTECATTSFTVALVAYTRQHTTLGSKRPGELVNLEVDIIAKYVEQLLEKKAPGLTSDFLAQHGFLGQ